MEVDPTAIRVAGGAELDGGERQISGRQIELEMGESGGWERIEVEGNVVFRDPAGTAEGERLTFERSTDEIVLYGSETMPATFVGAEGISTQSQEALRLTWQAENVLIETIERGRTRTRLVPRQASES